MGRKKRGRDIDGIIVINKPLGLSSNQVLQRVKRLFNANKAGHTGALDPLATGVLPICLGEATKFSQVLLDADKGYQTTAQLGEVRSTGDAEGEILERYPIPDLTDQRIATVIAQHLGEIEQVPPMFSALKLNGQPLYKLARQGMSAEDMQAVADKKRRIITIKRLQLEGYSESSMDLSVTCSKGTYIRTLVEDMGRALGSGAYVSRLHRTLSAPFTSEQMIDLESLENTLQQGGLDALDQYLLPLELAIPSIWPIIDLADVEIAAIRQGQRIRCEALEAGHKAIASVQLRAADLSGRPCIGIGRYEDGWIYPSRVLNRAQLDS